MKTMKTIKKANHTIGSVMNRVIKNPMQGILALGVSLGFFTIIGFLLLKPLPEGVKDVLLTLFGSLTTIIIQVYQFYFGSSKGSQEKADTIHKAVIAKTEPGGGD